MGYETHVAFQPLGEAPVTYYVDFTYQPLTDAQGQPIGILAFIVDVTEKVRARQHADALQAELLAATQRHVQERETLYQVFEQTSAMVQLLRGPHHHVAYVNPAYQRLFPGRPLVGLDLAEAVPELLEQGFIAILDGVYQTGETHFGLEVPLLMDQPGGQPPRTGYFTFTYQPYHENGQIVGISLFAHEVSEQALARLEQDAQREQVRALLEREAQREQVENLNQELAAINEEMQATNEELNDANHQLTRTNVDLDNFIYTASHDLKAPISNLEGLLYLLREVLPADVVLADNNVAPTLDFMSNAVERFKRTIEHLTEVSKLQKEHARPAAALDLAAVVENVRLDLLPLLEETKAQLTVAVTDFPPILFSEKNLRSVVFNLLSNALKYRHPDRRPHVDVQAHVRGGFTVLEVHDNGLGLDAHHLPRLFTMFQRFHDHVEGTGIGLYMVKRMVENAGGRIEVHSQLGAGTTFFVHLPHAPVPTP
ncbi:sensor histidine kinase [Hymenobacter sp.]|uniref:sensor histidine kinase n=1 Tax=Hymenobacter sp. TaxID=1898978 RepID=UPI002ED9559D